MLILAASDNGGTGRSVTSCNLAYRISLMGRDVAYLDFDFGSPNAGAIFEIPSLERGSRDGGLHSSILGRTSQPARAEIRGVTERTELTERPPGSGKLTLFPGDLGGAEFHVTSDHIDRVVQLFRKVEQEFDVCVVDLSAGRSAALDMSLHAVSPANRSKKADPVRLLLFHRWTTQHVIAASGLLFEDNGIISCAVDAGFGKSEFLRLVRTVRTAVPNSSAFGGESTPEQERWVVRSDDTLKALAKSRGLGQDMLLGTTPLEPMLLWREQILTDADVRRRLAKAETPRSFDNLAIKVIDDHAWEGF
ncbi:hypothetical protein ABH926_009123 [Catenulispora sp. GP43]|uniref:SCO2523 family variant P-loop protein n=1 Tax=Catenulispora sp. GP43 TaxID=3156263 RepID=UPI003516886D